MKGNHQLSSHRQNWDLYKVLLGINLLLLKLLLVGAHLIMTLS